MGHRVFCSISTNVFSQILYRVLPEATQTYPERFGTRNADNIIEALYDIEPWDSIKKFASFLSTEQFSWIIEVKNGIPMDRILRIDLFRKINSNPNGTSDFTGGLFHAFKHFSFRGVPLSTHNEKNDISYPGQIISYLMRAFFFTEGTQISSKHYRSWIPLNDKYNLRVEFYFEPKTKVYFIKTVIKEKKG